jgi:hypothetical protein
MRPTAKSGRPDFFGFSNRMGMAPLSIVSHEDGRCRHAIHFEIRRLRCWALFSSIRRLRRRIGPFTFAN